MEVVKVTLSRDYSMFDMVMFKGSILYVTKSTYRENNSSVGRTKVFNEDGRLLGTFIGYWFDFAGKTLFNCESLN